MNHETKRTDEVAPSEAGTGAVAGIGETGDKPEREHKHGDKGRNHLAPLRPKNESITLTGFGKRDGSDVNNSLSLVDFYHIMLGVKP